MTSPPPLRLTIVSSADAEQRRRARTLEATLDGTAAGIGWDLGNLETPAPGTERLGERLEMRVFASAPATAAEAWLDAAFHSVVIVLVDDKLLSDDRLITWLKAAAERAGASRGRHTLVAVTNNDQVQEQWVARSRAIGDLQTLPWAGLDVEPAGRLDQLALRVLGRMIDTLAREVQPPGCRRLRVFISHAKQDGFQLAQSIRHYLGEQHWLESYYDARDIQPGENWKDALREGVRKSLLLVLRTDAYDQRFWCRQEVRWAEEAGIPRVVVDARSGLVHPGVDLALDDAPTVRVPDGNLARVLFACLQTHLRSLIFQRRVQALSAGPPADPSIGVLPVTPRIVAIDELLRRADGQPITRLLYPDPPLRPSLLRAAEALAHAKNVRLHTPSQLQAEGAGPAPDLGDVRVGFSTSESDDLAGHGFTPPAVNRFTVRLARALLQDGASLAFGHDWRPEGVMEAIAGIALDLRYADRAWSGPPILNFPPWPADHSATDPALLRRLEGLVEVRQPGPPAGADGADVREHPRYWTARGLTHMRHALIDASTALVAVGGKLEKYSGRMPGIVEEVLFALQAGHPVYLAGLLGGAAAVLGRVLLGEAEPKALWDGIELQKLYDRRENTASGTADTDLDLDAFGTLLTSAELRARWLNGNGNGLGEDENRRLLESTLEEEVIELVRLGLRRRFAAKIK